MMGVSLNVQHHQQFQRAKPGVPILFSIALKHHKKSHLVLKQCLRVVPGKRVVALADWNGQEVIAKVFFHPKHSRRHLQREAAGLSVLNDAFIASPKVLLEDEGAHDVAIQVLLLERIAPADSFQDIWAHSEDDQERRQRLLQKATALVAELHLSKLLQVDFHLNNMLIKNNTLYVIDAGMLKVCSRRIPVRCALDNLAQFLAQFSFAGQAEIDDSLSVYAAHRQWAVSSRQRKYLYRRVRHWLSWRYRHLSKKLFRCCTQFSRHAFLGEVCVVDRIYEGECFLREFHSVYRDCRDLSPQFMAIRVKRSLLARKTKHVWRQLHRWVLYGVACPKPAAVLFESRLFSRGLVVVERPVGLPLVSMDSASVNDETRSSILRHKDEALAKLNRLGVTLDEPDAAFVIVGERVMLNDFAFLPGIVE